MDLREECRDFHRGNHLGIVCGCQSQSRAGKLISIVGGPRVIYHDSLRAERREGEYTRIDTELATVACIRLRRDRHSGLSVKTTRVWRSEN